jgi:hypothetical protein
MSAKGTIEFTTRLRAAPHLATLDQQPRSGDDKHGQQRRGDHAADHRSRNTLHYFRPGAMAEHDGDETREDHGDGHRFRPHAQHGAFADGVAEKRLGQHIACVEPMVESGERVVRGQQVMQAASDIFLGWATGPSGHHFYFRQLRDMKLSANIELFDVDVLEGYARMCGWILGRAHAKASGKAIEISGYLGQGTQFAKALVTYSKDYADQVERDFDLFTQAVRTGRLVARTDEDMAANFHV